MHSFRSKTEILRFTLGAWALFLIWALMPGAVFLMIVAGWTFCPRWTLWCALALSAICLLGLTWLIVSYRARCPLCVAKPLFPNRCSLNRKTRVWFGSFRLPVAASIVFRRRFRCPFCSETAALRIRKGGLRAGSGHGTPRPVGGRR